MKKGECVAGRDQALVGQICDQGVGDNAAVLAEDCTAQADSHRVRTASAGIQNQPGGVQSITGQRALNIDDVVTGS